MVQNQELFQRFEDICQRRGDKVVTQISEVVRRGGFSRDTDVLCEELLPSPRFAPDEDVQEVVADQFVQGDDINDEEAWRREHVQLSEEESSLDNLLKNIASDTPPRPLFATLLTSSQLTDLRQLQEEIDSNFSRWQDNIWSGLGRLRKRVAAISQNGAAQTEHLEVLARGVERDLEVFKAQQRQEFETLALQEPNLEDTLSILSRRFDGWLAEGSCLPHLAASPARSNEAGGSLTPRRGYVRSEVGKEGGSAPTGPSSLHVANDDPELQEIRNSLKNIAEEVEKAGGQYGGWNQYHHEVFIRIFRIFKLQATESCYARLLERFPDRNKEELAEHIAWFNDNETRQGRRRVLLAKWRRRKQELEQAGNQRNEPTAEEKELKKKAEEQERQLRAEQRRKVSDWRQAKAEEEERQALRRQKEAEDEARLAREQLRQQQKQLKETVEVFRHRREMDRQASQERVQRPTSARKRALSQEDRQRIAQRNCELLKKKLQAGLPLPRPEEPRRNSAYDHIESRLYSQTESFVQKITNKVGVDSDVYEHSHQVVATGEDLPRFNQRAHSVGPPKLPIGLGGPMLGSVAGSALSAIRR